MLLAKTGIRLKLCQLDSSWVSTAKPDTEKSNYFVVKIFLLVNEVI